MRRNEPPAGRASWEFLLFVALAGAFGMLCVGALIGVLGRSNERDERSWAPEERAIARAAVREQRRRSEAARIRSEDSRPDLPGWEFPVEADPTALLAGDDTWFVPAVWGPLARIFAVPGAKETVIRDEEIEGRRVLHLGPGTFRLASRRSVIAQGVDALEIRGAGRDVTTLRLLESSLVLTRHELTLGVRDLTIESDNGTVRHSGGRLVAAFERVRFRSTRASASIEVTGQAHLALNDCEFEVAGRWSLNAIALHGPALVVARDCRFTDLDAAVLVQPGAKGGRVRLEGCTYRNTRLEERWIPYGWGAPDPELPEVCAHGGDVTYLGLDVSDEERRERWGASAAAEVRDVRFGPDPSVPTLRDVLAVLESPSLPHDERVVEVQTLAWGRDGRPPLFKVFSLDRRGGPARPWRAALLSSGPVLSHPVLDDPILDLNELAGGTGLPPTEAVFRALPLAEAIRVSRLSLDTTLAGVVYASAIDFEGPASVLFYRLDRRLGAVIDGRDGRVVVPR